jgi:hypothetical protein
MGHHQVVEARSSELTIRDCRPRVPVIANLPGFGNDAIRRIPFAEHIDYQPLSKGVRSHVIREFQRIPVHRSQSSTW